MCPFSIVTRRLHTPYFPRRRGTLSSLFSPVEVGSMDPVYLGWSVSTRQFLCLFRLSLSDLTQLFKPVWYSKCVLSFLVLPSSHRVPLTGPSHKGLLSPTTPLRPPRPEVTERGHPERWDEGRRRHRSEEGRVQGQGDRRRRVSRNIRLKGSSDR